MSSYAIASSYNCINCNPNTFANAGVCISCPTNCATCSQNLGKTTCTSCSTGFLSLDSTSCIPCQSNCDSCINNGANNPYCQTCTTNYFLNIDHDTCSDCPTLISHCNTCSQTVIGSFIKCTACDTSYTISSSTFYCLDNACLSIPNCVSCTSGIAPCTLCDYKFFINGAGTCSSC